MAQFVPGIFTLPHVSNIYNTYNVVTFPVLFPAIVGLLERSDFTSIHLRLGVVCMQTDILQSKCFSEYVAVEFPLY